ncbi:MAG: Crp/Fnr family transcriptional regulator [Candidatus Bipolaricaulia bacterium]
MTERRHAPIDRERVPPSECTTERRRKVLRNVPFFQDLSDDTVAAINERFRAFAYEADETIYHSGRPASELHVVADGHVRLVRYAQGGQRVVLDVLASGELFGGLALLGNSVYSDTAEAKTDCCVLGIEAKDFRNVLRQHPNVALRVLDHTSKRLRSAHETIEGLSAHSVGERIAALLLQLGEKLGESTTENTLIQMPLSRRDIAAMVGTTPETASRILSEFRSADLIDSGRQWIALRDAERLGAIAEGIPLAT